MTQPPAPDTPDDPLESSLFGSGWDDSPTSLDSSPATPIVEPIPAPQPMTHSWQQPQWQEPASPSTTTTPPPYDPREPTGYINDPSFTPYASPAATSYPEQQVQPLQPEIVPDKQPSEGWLTRKWLWIIVAIIAISAGSNLHLGWIWWILIAAALSGALGSKRR